MPPVMSKPSGAAPTSLFYITLGAIITVWSGVWYAYLRHSASENHGFYYICMGLLGTGLVLLIIGFSLGPLARMARHAELPPSEVTKAAVRNEEGATNRA